VSYDRDDFDPDRAPTWYFQAWADFWNARNPTADRDRMRASCKATWRVARNYPDRVVTAALNALAVELPANFVVGPHELRDALEAETGVKRRSTRVETAWPPGARDVSTLTTAERRRIFRENFIEGAMEVLTRRAIRDGKGGWRRGTRADVNMKLCTQVENIIERMVFHAQTGDDPEQCEQELAEALSTSAEEDIPF